MVLLKIASRVCFLCFGHVPKLNPSITRNLVNSCQPPKKSMMCKLVVMAVNTKDRDLENTCGIAVIHCFEKKIVKNFVLRENGLAGDLCSS